MKTVLIYVLLGIIIGAAAASLIVPPTLSWYNEAGFLSSPQGGQVQALVNIPQVVRYSTDRLIKGQLVGAGIGAVAFFVIGLLASRRRSRPALASPEAVPRRPDPGAPLDPSPGGGDVPGRPRSSF